MAKIRASLGQKIWPGGLGLGQRIWPGLGLVARARAKNMARVRARAKNMARIKD